MFAEVAIPRSSPDALTYAVPTELEELARPGVRVRVTVRARPATGLVVSLASSTELDPVIVQPILEVLDLEPLLPDRLLELAGFISSYYRCPLATTLAAMLPAALLRSDVEEASLTIAGARVEVESLPPAQAAALRVLQQAQKVSVASLLARAGIHGRQPVDALVDAGYAAIRRRRRDREPKVEVAAVQLADRPIDELLEACGRAHRQREVLDWLSARRGPALLSELRAAVGCSAGVINTLVSRGALVRFTQRPARRPRWTLPTAGEPHDLTDEQRAAVDAIEPAIRDRRFAPFLLRGVTGSGKTEVYLRCLEAALDSGRSGLVLVPEIGLTPAASGAVERRFGRRAAVLHSAQSEGERWREWQRVRSGEARIVVGPRSALFCPLEDLGLVVVDEEHDAAYKQQESPRYHARDVALVVGQRAQAPVLLCSATPSVEGAALVLRDRAQLLELTRRVAGGTLPEVEIVDLRRQPPDPGEQGRTLFSDRLRDSLADTVAAGDQVILLMQRRGWAPVLLCRDCGGRIDCPSCSVSMVVHRRTGDLECHYCGRRRRPPAICDRCGGGLLDAVGAGTEKVAHHLERLFPGVRSVILDRDTVRLRHGLADTLGAFAAGRAQVLIGTQMVAKGHHFPNVTLTGVISADAMLGLPDFRAGERTFQLLTQVAGRAGRGDKPGRVIIQTYHPDHPAVRHAAHHDVSAFLDEELTFRRAFDYPPWVRLAVVRWQSATSATARGCAEHDSRQALPLPPGVRLRGPAPAPIERIRGRWRWQALISSPNRELLREAVARIERDRPPDGVRRVVDVDPLSTL